MRRINITPLITLLLLSIGAHAQALKDEADSRGVINTFQGKSFAELRREFEQYKTPVYQKNFRSLIIETNIRQGDLKISTDKEEVRKARARVSPVLKLYGRESIEIIIFESPAPNAICIGGTAIFYSTGMLQLAHDKELQAITAHELAHEYVNTLALSAREQGDYQTLRRAELMCDAFAVAALRELKINPSAFKSILKKLTRSPYAVAWKGDGTDTHPALQTRLETITLLASALKR